MMAERPQPTEFVYHNIELYKSESLGSGSYGGVCKAKCDGLLCAAKIMHPTLFDLRNPGTASYLSKFREECHLLSLARHPNIVQYLGTFTDPDTRLPVLLMELCEESLTAFLERSPGPLPYHIQVDICHDIALALVYLHSNSLIHRDLTGNNVLMIAGPRAKITDFGMSKLANINPRMTTFTLCPGNVLYMSPEALNEAKSYTAKLDVFSFGVIVIQILTRQFPNPTDRFRLVSLPQFSVPLRQEVPEVERRATHLNLIPEFHSLKSLVLICIKTKEEDRPSALELSERLSAIKQSPQYQSRPVTKAEHSQCAQERIAELERIVEVKDRELQERDQQLQAKDREINEREREHLDGVLVSRVHEFELKEEELQASELLLIEFQQSLQQRDRTIIDLQRTISAHERKIQQLEQQDMAGRHTPHQKTVTAPQTTVANGGKDISKIKWRKGKNAPEPMKRGAAVVHGKTLYFRPEVSVKVYSYQFMQGDEQWSQLSDNPNCNCGLVVIHGLLTSVGGEDDNGYTNILLSIKGSERKKWSEIFPPMPTPRSRAACVTAGNSLVVAGGKGGLGSFDIMEVMNTHTEQWTTVTPLPAKCSDLSATVHGNKLYLAGEYGLNIFKGYGEVRSSKSVFTCSIPHLFPSTKLSTRLRRSFTSSRGVWREIGELPVERSTLVSFGGDLLAIGGIDASHEPTSNVYRYDSHTNSWTVVSQMINKRSSCFAVSSPEDQLIVVGGYNEQLNKTESVEINSQ